MHLYRVHHFYSSMETALSILSDEHQNILKVIDALLTECDGLESGKALDTEFFTKAIAFVREYADRFHHAKEEDVLFVELGKDDVHMHCDPLQQMRHEHELGRNFITALEKGVAENNKDKILENAKGYAQLLKEHIFKEDNVLFPMADTALHQNSKDNILEKFKQIDQDKNQEKHLLFLKELEGRK